MIEEPPVCCHWLFLAQGLECEPLRNGAENVSIHMNVSNCRELDLFWTRIFEDKSRRYPDRYRGIPSVVTCSPIPQQLHSSKSCFHPLLFFLGFNVRTNQHSMPYKQGQPWPNVCPEKTSASSWCFEPLDQAWIT